MADKPTGRYALKIEGKPLQARKYHLYKDCGVVATPVTDESGRQISTLMDVGDDIIELMVMDVCSVCSRRSLEVDPEDLIAEAIARGLDAKRIIEVLESGGYVIRRTRGGSR